MNSWEKDNRLAATDSQSPERGAPIILCYMNNDAATICMIKVCIRTQPLMSCNTVCKLSFLNAR